MSPGLATAKAATGALVASRDRLHLAQRNPLTHGRILHGLRFVMPL